MTIPVLIVPGIMGTRLVDRRGRSAWDPDAGGRIHQVRQGLALRDPRTPAFPAPSAGMARDAWFRARGVVNGGHLVWDNAYRNLVTALSDPAFASECGQRVRVYGAGYDWRQSNVVSARLLRLVVERALRETRSRRVVLVAHSMGGIVSRLFCRFSVIARMAGVQFVSRLILLGSPTHGAPESYRMLRQSVATPDDISDIPLDTHDEGVPAFAGRAFAAIIKEIPAIYELLPTQAYCAGNPNWLTFDRSRAGLPNAADPRRVYRNRLLGLPAAPRSVLAARDAIDRGLGTYMPPQSVIVHGIETATEGAYRVENGGALRERRGNALNTGDGTVPTFSGSAAASPRGPTRIALRGVSHGGVASDAAAIGVVKRLIVQSCSTATRSTQ